MGSIGTMLSEALLRHFNHLGCRAIIVTHTATCTYCSIYSVRGKFPTKGAKRLEKKINEYFQVIKISF